jgi:hypothetical protein
MRDVKKIDKNYIGPVPGIDDGEDQSVKVQLPILGGADAPARSRGG